MTKTTEDEPPSYLDGLEPWGAMGALNEEDALERLGRVEEACSDPFAPPYECGNRQQGWVEEGKKGDTDSTPGTQVCERLLCVCAHAMLS